MTKKKSFLLYLDQDYLVDMLKEEEAGRLFRDLFRYGKDHTVPDYGDNRALSMAFQTFKTTMDRDAEKYEAMCEKNRTNARKRWKQTGYPSEGIRSDTTAYEGDGTVTVVTDHMREHPVDADRDRDIENVKDTDSDKDILRAIAGSRTTTFRKTRDTRKNSFHNFEQRDYDYQTLEKALIKKQRETYMDDKEGGAYDQRRKTGEGKSKTGEKHEEAGAVCHEDQSFREEAAGRKQKETETTGCPQ